MEGSLSLQGASFPNHKSRTGNKEKLILRCHESDKLMGGGVKVFLALFSEQNVFSVDASTPAPSWPKLEGGLRIGASILIQLISCLDTAF